MPDGTARLGDRELLYEAEALQVYNPDKGFEYRFVHKNDGNVMRKQLAGYEICTGQSGEKLGATGLAAIKTGTPLMVGDMILMRIPKDKYAARAAMRAERVKIRTGAVDKQFIDEVRRTGGTFVHPLTGRQADPEADKEK